MRSLTLSLLLTVAPCLTMAGSPKEFLDCGLEAEIAMRVIDSKMKGKPLNEIVTEWIGIRGKLALIQTQYLSNKGTSFVVVF